VLINCNSAPWLTTLGPEISSYWPSYISSYGHTSRYDRLAALLGSSAPVSIDLAMADATDTQAPDALSTVALLVAAASGGPAAPDVAAAIKTLSAWNGRADSDSRGCALYWYWLRADTACLKLAAQAESGVAWNAGENDTALGALASAVQTMHAQFGGTDIPWGRMHVIDRGTISTPVSGFSVGDTAAVVPNTGEESNGVIHCTVGSSFRMVVDLDPAGVRSWSILPFGESQDPDNPHYADQCALFGQGTYKDDFFGLANARAHAVTSVAITAP
jgi:acyl-homoserine lactone acylase PvdQ